MIKILLSVLILFNLSITVLNGQPQGQVIWSRQGTGGIYAAFPTYDYNNDGHPDVVAAAYYGAYPSPPIRLFLVSGLDGSAIWTRADCQGIWGNRGLSTISDISGDSMPDIIMGTPGGIFPGRTVFAINGVTSATIWSHSYYPDAGWVYSVRPTVDINNDGYPEVLAGVGTISTDQRGTAQCFCGHTGTSLWSFRPNDAVMCIAPHFDINNDTVPEVMLASGGNSLDNKIYCLNGRTGAQIWSYNTGGSVEYVIQIGDINSNGVPDVVGGGWAYKVVCCDGLTGNLLWQNNLGSGRVIYDLRRIRDINNDGYDDIVVGSWSSVVSVLSGQTGVILWSQTIGADCWNVDTIKDITGDGITDIAAAALNGKVVKILNGVNGDVIWQYSFLDRIYDVACAGDLDGDSIVDVLVSLQDQQSQPYQLYAFKNPRPAIEEQNSSLIYNSNYTVKKQKHGVLINLAVAVGKNFTVQLYDLNGRIVEKTMRRKSNGNETFYIAKGTKPSGIYFVRIEIEDYKAETVKILLY